MIHLVKQGSYKTTTLEKSVDRNNWTLSSDRKFRATMNYSVDFSLSSDHIHNFLLHATKPILNTTISCHVNKWKMTMQNFTLSLNSKLKHLKLKHADLIQFRTPLRTNLSKEKNNCIHAQKCITYVTFWYKTTSIISKYLPLKRWWRSKPDIQNHTANNDSICDVSNGHEHMETQCERQSKHFWT